MLAASAAGFAQRCVLLFVACLLRSVLPCVAVAAAAVRSGRVRAHDEAQDRRTREREGETRANETTGESRGRSRGEDREAARQRAREWA